MRSTKFQIDISIISAGRPGYYDLLMFSPGAVAIHSPVPPFLECPDSFPSEGAYIMSLNSDSPRMHSIIKDFFVCEMVRVRLRMP